MGRVRSQRHFNGPARTPHGALTLLKTILGCRSASGSLLERARSVKVAKLLELVAQHTEGSLWGFLGGPG